MMGGTPAITGEKVAEYASYEAAQKAVSTLISADIPAREIAIVGYGLRSVETVTGRLGYATAARTGAINGILLGLIFSLIFVFGTPDAAIQLFLGVMLVGVAIGMMMSGRSSPQKINNPTRLLDLNSARHCSTLLISSTMTCRTRRTAEAARPR